MRILFNGHKPKVDNHNYQKSCPNCGCVFAFNDFEFQASITNEELMVGHVRCPWCFEHLTITKEDEVKENA